MPPLPPPAAPASGTTRPLPLPSSTLRPLKLALREMGATLASVQAWRPVASMGTRASPAALWTEPRSVGGMLMLRRDRCCDCDPSFDLSSDMFALEAWEEKERWRDAMTGEKHTHAHPKKRVKERRRRRDGGTR